MPSSTTPNNPTNHSYRLIASVLCCLAFAFAIIPAANADAGTLILLSCSQPGGTPAPTEGWTTGTYGSVGPDSGDIDSCPERGALIARSSGEAPQNAYGGPMWTFHAPSWASSITGGTLTATLTSAHGQAWLGTPNPTYDSADVLANCQYNLACGQAGSLTGVFPITHTGGTSIYAVAVCVAEHEGATSCPANGGLDASTSISAAAIELANSSTPTATGFTGSLLNPNARGTQQLLFTASDPNGPGIYTVTAEIDGTTFYTGTPDSNGGDCAAAGTSNGTLMFDHAQPCPQSESIDLPIDTATIPDGAHTLKITLQDAAGNTSVVYDATISTENAPANTTLPSIAGSSQPTVGSALAGQPGTWSAPAGAGPISYTYQWQDCNSQGENCQPIPGGETTSYNPAPSDAGHTLRMLTTASDNDGSASATSAPSSSVLAAAGNTTSPPNPTSHDPAVQSPLATPTPGAPNGAGASEQAVLELAGSRTLSRSFARRAFTLSGRLTNSQSQPITDAMLDVLQEIAGTNTLTIIGHTTTSPTGSFALTVPPGPSRTIEIAYRALSSDTNYTATAEIHETVHATAQLTITPPDTRPTGTDGPVHTTPTGTIEISGKVAGPIPPHGITVELFVHYRGHWEPIRDPETGSHGHFHLEYQFQDAIGRFPFRIKIPAGQTNYPYTSGYSNTMTVSTG